MRHSNRTRSVRGGLLGAFPPLRRGTLRRSLGWPIRFSLKVMAPVPRGAHWPGTAGPGRSSRSICARRPSIIGPTGGVSSCAWAHGTGHGRGSDPPRRCARRLVRLYCCRFGPTRRRDPAVKAVQIGLVAEGRRRAWPRRWTAWRQTLRTPPFSRIRVTDPLRVRRFPAPAGTE